MSSSSPDTALAPTEPQLAVLRGHAQLVVIGLVVGMLAAVVVLALLIPDLTEPTVAVGWGIPLFVLVAYGVCELTVFNVVFREHGISFSLSEIPFALTLAMVAPVWAVVLRLALAIPVLVIRRHNRGLKLTFNISLFVFELALGYTLVRAAISWWGMSSSVLVGSVAVTLVVTSIVTSMLISSAIASYEGGVWERIVTEVRETWWMYPITSVFGAMTLALALVEPAFAALAALPAAGAWYVLHRFGVQNQTLRNLHTLYGFAGRVGRSLDVGEICNLAVEELAADFRATGVALVRFGSGEPSVHTTGVVPNGLTADDRTGRWSSLAAGQAMVLRRDELRRLGLDGASSQGPAYMCPLVDAGHVLGVVLVFVPAVLVGDHAEGDLARLNSIAEQLSVSLRRGMLHERLEYEARHDALTDLPARTLFERAVADALASDDDGEAAVMMLDLDRFKEVNDTLGHHAGDALLVEFSRRMTELLHPGDMLARLAGDEFAIVCRRDHPDGVIELARACVAAGGRPVVLDGLEIVVTVSVGVALANPGETDALQPMRRADIAMYNAKWQRTGVEVYRDEIDRRTPARLSMLGDLRAAIENDEITVVYQPKLELRTLDVVGVEALVRWHSPTRGVVSPAEFVRVAEDTGLIKDLTDLVLEHGIAALRRFDDLGLGLRMAVNLSTHDLFDTRLPDRVMSRLDRHGVSPSALTLEITESSLLVDAPRTRATIDDLHQAGFRLAIDDFGTGYSSLSYLRRLPVQELKIDQSFVSGMLSDPQDEVIVKSTIDLGHNLRLWVVAEGVEDDATLQALAAMGCDVAQGFGIARPLAAHDLIDWIARARRQQVRARALAARAAEVSPSRAG